MLSDSSSKMIYSKSAKPGIGQKPIYMHAFNVEGVKQSVSELVVEAASVCNMCYI